MPYRNYRTALALNQMRASQLPAHFFGAGFVSSSHHSSFLIHHFGALLHNPWLPHVLSPLKKVPQLHHSPHTTHSRTVLLSGIVQEVIRPPATDSLRRMEASDIEASSGQSRSRAQKPEINPIHCLSPGCPSIHCLSPGCPSIHCLSPGCPPPLHVPEHRF